MKNVRLRNRKKTSGTKHFLFIAFDDVEPNIEGPFDTPAIRDVFAKTFRDKEGPDHGIFALDIDENGVPETWAYPGVFFDDDDN